MWGEVGKQLLQLFKPIESEVCPASPTDKRCGVALLGLLVAVTVCYELTDGAALRAQAAEEADKPPVELVWQAPMEQPRLLEAITAQLEPDSFREDVPLDRELQAALREACAENEVPVPLALGLIEVESRFNPEADNGLCYGLCQLNKRYYPDDLSPEENLRAGVAHLGELLARYDDPAAALTAYNAGHDTGSRTYASAVLGAAERWED